MNRLRAHLPSLQAAMLLPVAGAPAPAVNAQEVGAYIRAIDRKARFAQMHLEVLAGVQWDRVESIGRRPSDGSNPSHLAVRLSDASLVIEHSEAVIDHVYLAFDGATAALVNIPDTLGRLLNARYSLKIDSRKASLFAVRDQCSATSSLGTLLWDPVRTEWLRKVRDLRGRCQHADVDDVLMSGESPYSRRGQPFIHQDYSWNVPAKSLPIVEFAQQAAQAAESALVAFVSAILSAPHNPFI